MAKKDYSKIKRSEVIKIIKTSRTHSWVQTDKGIFRRENKNIPAEMFDKK